MVNKSKKRRNKKIKIISIISFILLLIISYFISNKDKKVNVTDFSDVYIEEPSSHIRGNLSSSIKLIEYSDYQCPACAATESYVDSLLEQYGDKFQLEYRNFPLRSIHPNAQIAAQAAEASGMQGKYWEMHKLLFGRQDEWSKSTNPKRIFKKYAEEIGINVDRFTFDLTSDILKEIVNDQYNEAMDLNLPGTPSFVFNGEIVDLNKFIQDNLSNDSL